MDSKKAFRSILGDVTTINNEIDRKNIKECRKLKAEPANEDNMCETLENRYSIRDSIVFKEDLEDIMVDETSNKSSEYKAQLGNQVSFRDLIMYDEDFPMNMDNNAKPNKNNPNTTMATTQFLKTTKTSDIQIKPELSNEGNIPDSYCESFKNSIVYKEDLKDLYKNHTLKEEIVIGPEIVQSSTDLQDEIFADMSIAKINKKKLKNKKHKTIYKCKCGEMFSVKKDFVKHTCKTKYVCDHCEKSFQSKHEISNHMQIHMKKNTKQLPYDKNCTMCPSKFKFKTSLEKHMLIHKNPHKTQGLHECDICHKVFTMIGNLKRHTNAHLGAVYQCDKCSKSYKTNESLQHHKVRHHTNDTLLQKTKLVACRYCSKHLSFNTSKRNQHERLYCPSNPERAKIATTRIMQCDICQKTYIHKQSLIDHILLHMGKQPSSSKRQEVQCDLCLKKFKRKFGLRHHMENTHMKVKKNCKLCEKKFTKYHLTKHEKSCQSISKRDCQSGSSNMDKSKHKFGCDLCSKKYKTKPGLKFHKQSKHFNVNYKCNYCGVGLSRVWSLNCHEKKCLAKNSTQVDQERDANSSDRLQKS